MNCKRMNFTPRRSTVSWMLAFNASCDGVAAAVTGRSFLDPIVRGRTLRGVWGRTFPTTQEKWTVLY